MQELIRLIIERAKRTEDRFTLDGKQDAATILAEEVIRLAHLATTTHMLRSAQDKARACPVQRFPTVEHEGRHRLSEQARTGQKIEDLWTFSPRSMTRNNSIPYLIEDKDRNPILDRSSANDRSRTSDRPEPAPHPTPDFGGFCGPTNLLETPV